MSEVYDFSGIWLSKYTYHSDSRNQDFEDTHYVRIYPRRDKLVIESIPEVNRSYVVFNLRRHDDIATGTWQETTDPEGYYKGAIYHGAIQMVISPNGKSFKGRWIGAGKDKVINDGPYELTYIGKELPANTEKAQLGVVKS